MIEGRTVLGIIPARGGSKELPRKNVLDLGGKPLIVWSIDAAINSQFLDRVVLSSDDMEIIDVAKSWGCDVPYLRPDYLAADDTPTVDVVLHLLKILPENYDYIVLLQPTSPLRLASDIDTAIRRCVDERAPACVSMAEAQKSPYKMYTIIEGGTLVPIMGPADTTLRQSLPKAYVTNGAVYVAATDWLRRERRFEGSEAIAYIMPPERSIDIDNELDLQFASLILSHRHALRTTQESIKNGHQRH